MKNEVIYVLLDNWADYESAYISTSINCNRNGLRDKPLYVNKVASSSLDLVKSAGGLYVKPDYSFDTMPSDYAALILIGGYSWKSKDADRLVPVIENALSKGIVVGAICSAASFFASKGFVNNIKHTGNGLDDLKRWGGDAYTNEAGYQNQQVVRDGNIITANGTASLEFAAELMRTLKTDSEEEIEQYYQFMKMGFCDFIKMIMSTNNK